MDQRWFEDIMSQTFHEDICFNPSKLFLLQFLMLSNSVEKKYMVKDFQRYLYRIYSDNPDVAIKHPSYIIRNIQKYGVSDLCDLATDTLDSWKRDAQNSVLHSNEKAIVLDIDLQDIEDTVLSTKRLCKMLFKKLYKCIPPEVDDIKGEVITQDDHDIQRFGQGPFRRRVLEDMQYCPICEEIATEKLVCVHIYEKTQGASTAELCDKDNGLIFCIEHAKQFFDRKFVIDELGFIKNIDSKDVEEGAHLSFAIRSGKRKEYLQKRRLADESSFRK